MVVVVAVFVHPPIDLSFGEDERRRLLLVLQQLVRTDRSTDPPLLLPLLLRGVAALGGGGGGLLPSAPHHHLLRSGRHIRHFLLLVSRSSNSNIFLRGRLPFVWLLRHRLSPRE